MASMPPMFEVEDQTDEDFFDKLVDDDDDDDDDEVAAGGGGGSNKAAETSSGVFGDGEESDEAKAFAKLSLNEAVDGNGNLDAKIGSGGDVLGKGLDLGGGNELSGDVDRSIVSSDSFAFDRDLVVSSEVDGGQYDGLEVKGEAGGDAEGWNWDGKLEDVLGADDNPLACAADSFSFNDGTVPSESMKESEVKPEVDRGNGGDSAPPGVKVVQWNAFSESAAHGIDGFGSYSDFFTGVGEGTVDDSNGESKVTPDGGANNVFTSENSYNFVEYQGKHESVEQSTEPPDLTNSQYYESQYPGWKYDPYTGQWYQIDGYAGTVDGQQNIEGTAGNGAGSFAGSADGYWVTGDSNSSQTYAQQTAQSVAGTISQVEAAPTQVSVVSNEYPAHMIFDPQYPGWYYDTIAQEWRTLETYHSSVQSADQSAVQSVAQSAAQSTVQPTVQSSHQQFQNGFATTANNSLGYHHSTYNYGSSNISGQNWTSHSSYSQQGSNMWQPEASHVGSSTADSIGDQAWENAFDSNVYANSFMGQQNVNNIASPTLYGKTGDAYGGSAFVAHQNNLISVGSYAQQFSPPGKVEPNGVLEQQNEYYGNQRAESFSQQFVPNGQFVPNVGRSSEGRPPHALVTFGFGGKLIVMKDGSSLRGGKDSGAHSISVLNLMEIAKEQGAASGPGRSTCSYFQSLCHRPFPGPLVGGSVGNKDVNKWIDESISSCDSPDLDHRKGRVLKLLLSLLKIACQHYGKLRSLGTEAALREHDLPESAVANLFASCKKDGGNFGQYYASTKFLLNLPSEAQMQRTASDVQNLLVAGKRKEALQNAEEGQLWPFALILARELGEQYYFDTVKRMAFSQLMAGTPLRTLCLLIAKKPEDVFSTNVAGGVVSPRSARMSPQPVQFMAYNMLDNWEENLAVITANRTENDHLVITHLGDSLWKEKNNIAAAHICYLVAEADFESYSEIARLCLVGGDHWNFPRTFASPEAIQRTELFEYSKVIGNSQFALLPFQPYKLVYAYMLAEVGKISDALKYCQAIYKSLKTGRSPEIDALKQLVASLEDRSRTHQQGGYAVNLAPAKIMGKLFNLFDSTTHRVVGGLPPPVPSNSHNHMQSYDQHQTVAPKVSNSQSTMAMSSLMSSASMEPLDNNRMTMHNRSLSEPDIGRTPRQDHVAPSNGAISTTPEGRSPASTGSSRFARFNFGSQILQKTVGLVLGSRHQAKLGEANKFRYDEKLKTWVEEGAETPAEAAAPPPPPTTGSFQSSTTDNFPKSSFSDGGPAVGSPEFGSSTSSESTPAFPSMPPSSNQYSARGRMGVRARYVDTFNKGGGSPANLFQTPSAPLVKPPNAATPNFFMPSAAPSNEQTSEPSTGNMQEASESTEVPSVPINQQSQKLPPTSATIPRFSSFDSIPDAESKTKGQYSASSMSRRTASWSGIPDNTFSPPDMGKFHHPGMPSGMSLLPSIPGNSSSDNLQMSRGGLGDDLQEVEL